MLYITHAYCHSSLNLNMYTSSVAQWTAIVVFMGDVQHLNFQDLGFKLLIGLMVTPT